MNDRSAAYYGRLENGRPVGIMVKGAVIAAVATVPENPELPFILPPLVDLQYNGALGCGFNDLHDQQADTLARMSRFLRAHGVGRCLATTTTFPYESIIRSVRFLNERLSADPELAGLFSGVFHEGVFISPRDGWRGAHAQQWIHKPDFDMFRALDEAAGMTGW